MGKNVKKKHNSPEQPERRYLPVKTLAGLVAAGVVLILGMALLNGNAKPNRDMQWYMKTGTLDVAAPSLAEGYEVMEAEDAAAQPEAAAPADASSQVEAADAVEVDGPSEPVGEAEGVDAQAETDKASDAGAEEAQAEVEVAREATEADPEADAAEGATADAAEDAAPNTGEDAAAEEEEEIFDGPVTITVTAAGDCTFGGQDGAKGRRRFMQYAKDYGYDYFFDGVRSIFENDDLTLVNLEGPLTTVEKPAKKAQFLFHGDPEYVNILTGSSVEVCNVANNHSRDYGTEGLKETASVLDAAGVGYCGYSQVYYTRIKGVRVGAMGFTWWDYNIRDVAKAIAEARENCDLLIVSVHWGVEYEYDQSYKQEDAGRAMIDAGADLVIGTHPHVFQGIEKYKGKYIVYSLGNFCFAGNANPSDKRCLIFQQTFSFTPGLGIAQAGIMDEGINIIPAFISSRKDLNDFQPTVMDAENGAKLLKSVARHSKGFTFADTLWMKDNYMALNGLVASQADEGGEDAEASEPEAAAEG